MEELPFECDLHRTPQTPAALTSSPSASPIPSAASTGSMASTPNGARSRSTARMALARSIVASRSARMMRCPHQGSWVLNTPEPNQVRVTSHMRTSNQASATGRMTRCSLIDRDRSCHRQKLSLRVRDSSVVAAISPQSADTSAEDSNTPHVDINCPERRSSGILINRICTTCAARQGCKSATPTPAPSPSASAPSPSTASAPKPDSNAVFRLNGKPHKDLHRDLLGLLGTQRHVPHARARRERSHAGARSSASTASTSIATSPRKTSCARTTASALLRYMEPGAGKMAIGKLPAAHRRQRQQRRHGEARQRSRQVRAALHVRQVRRDGESLPLASLRHRVLPAERARRRPQESRHARHPEGDARRRPFPLRRAQRWLRRASTQRRAGLV